MEDYIDDRVGLNMATYIRLTENREILLAGKPKVRPEPDLNF